LFFFDQILEYIETNGITGYQPQSGSTPGDYVVRTHSLVNSLRPNGATTWSKIQFSAQPIQNTSITVHTMSFNLQQSAATDVGSVYFALNVAVREVAIPINGSTTSLLVLEPAGAKFCLDIVGITYANASSTGLAIGVLHFSNGGALFIKPTNTSTIPPPASMYRPYDISTDQTVISHIDPVDNVEGSVFSFRNFFNVLLANKFQSHQVQIWGPQTITPPNGVPQTYTTRRFFFSTTTQVQAINWDPTIAASEDQLTSANYSSKSILSLSLFTILLSILLF